MSDSGKALPYDERVWKTGENGEPEYIGPATLTMTFNPPLALGAQTKGAPETTIAEITLTEPTAQHLSVFLTAQRTQDEAAAGIAFIAANAGVAPAFIKKIRSRDFARAMEFLGGFTPPEKKLQGQTPGA